VPEEPGRFFEGRVGGELAHRISGDDQLARFAVDVAEAGRRGDDVLEAIRDHRIVCHGAKL
jgi:hypothetical protein